MAWALTIDGTNRTDRVRQESSVRMSFLPNDRPRAFFSCLPGYVPERLREVVIYDVDGVTALFGGLVLKRTARGISPGATSMFVDVECGGFLAYLDWCYLSLTYAAATTLGTVLTAIVAALPASYGVTLSGTYAGTIEPFTWTNMRASDALRELSDKSGLIFTMSPAKVLSGAVPGSASAPVSLTDAAPNCREVAWTDADGIPANTVLVACGPTGTAWVTQSWTQAGGASSWVTDLPSGGPTAGYVTVGGVFCTVGPGAMYEWDDATHTLSVGTAATPANGTVITLTYTAQYPFIVTATAAASASGADHYFPTHYFPRGYFPRGYFRADTVAGTIEVQALYDSPTTLTRASGQQLADGLLAQLNQQATELEIDTLDRGSGVWAPGQAVTIALTGRGLSAVYQVTSVDVSLVSSTHWVWTVRATSGSTYQGGYLDDWRRLKGGGSSNSTGVAYLPVETNPPINTEGTVRMGDKASNAVEWDGSKLAASGATLDLSAMPFCAVSRVTSDTGTIPFDSAIKIPWNNEVSDVFGMHDTGTNPERVTVPAAGLYFVDLTVTFYEPSNAGPEHLSLHVLQNNTTAYGRLNLEFTLNNDFLTLHTSAMIMCSAGDYLEAVAGHQQGPNPSTLVVSYMDHTTMTVTKIH